MKKLIVFVFLSSFAFYFSNPHLKFENIDKNEIIINEIQIKNESGFDVQCALVDELDMIISKFTVRAFSTVTVDVGLTINFRVMYSGSSGLDYEYQAVKDEYSYPPTFVISSSNSGSSYGNLGTSYRNNGAYTRPNAVIDKTPELMLNAINEISDAFDKNPAVWHNRALKKYNKGDYRGALPLFEEAIKRAKGDTYEGLYFYRRGMTLKKLGMSYCNDFNIACELRNPDGCNAYKNYCLSNKQQNSYGNSSPTAPNFNSQPVVNEYNVATKTSSVKKAKRKKRWKTFFIIWGSLSLLAMITA